MSYGLLVKFSFAVANGHDKWSVHTCLICPHNMTARDDNSLLVVCSLDAL